ncbi:hypothetical protein FD733_03650 [Pantoea sp. Eser]|nr:hypothetical protein [Pantoea sp. Eser]
MISGGFKAAWDRLSPRYAAREGIQINTVAGPSIGKTPQAIPARLARGEHSDLVIMVGDALGNLEKQGRTLPGSRVELADSRIGAVVKQGATPVAIDSESTLRATLQYTTRFAGAVIRQSAQPDEASQLLRWLASPEVQKVVRETGLHPIGQTQPAGATQPIRQRDTVQ